MTEKTAARLESLRKRKAQLERRIADAESEAKVAARKLDARRKIVVGGAVLAAIADSPGLAAMVNPARVSRHDTRAARPSASAAPFAGETVTVSPFVLSSPALGYRPGRE